MLQVIRTLLITLALFSTSYGVQAGSVSTSIKVSVSVDCNCVVNGIIIPITQGLCISTCKELQNTKSPENIQKSTQNVVISQNGSTQVVYY